MKHPLRCLTLEVDSRVWRRVNTTQIVVNTHSYVVWQNVYFCRKCQFWLHRPVQNSLSAPWKPSKRPIMRDISLDHFKVHIRPTCLPYADLPEPFAPVIIICRCVNSDGHKYHGANLTMLAKPLTPPDAIMVSFSMYRGTKLSYRICRPPRICSTGSSVMMGRFSPKSLAARANAKMLTET